MSLENIEVKAVTTQNLPTTEHGTKETLGSSSDLKHAVLEQNVDRDLEIIQTKNHLQINHGFGDSLSIMEEQQKLTTNKPLHSQFSGHSLGDQDFKKSQHSNSSNHIASLKSLPSIDSEKAVSSSSDHAHSVQNHNTGFVHGSLTHVLSSREVPHQPLHLHNSENCGIQTIAARDVDKQTSAWQCNNAKSSQHKNGDDFAFPVPMPFSVDVASALDDVLNRKEEINKNGKSPLKSDARPCVLQHTSVVDYSSRSTSPQSTSTDGNSTFHHSNLHPGEERQLTNGIKFLKKSGKESSVAVKNSMMLGEESLNFVAQMTAPEKESKQISQMSKLNDVLSIATATSTNVSITSSKVSPYSMDDSNSKAPLISGTAAAKMDAMNRSKALLTTQEISSKALAPPPQLVPQKLPEKVSITSSAQSDLNIALTKRNVHEKSDEIIRLSNVSSALEDNSIRQSSQAMNILADIISHAPPLANNNEEISNGMVPVGQSLSVYTAIAAQAGVATHNPLSFPSSKLPNESKAGKNLKPERGGEGNSHVLQYNHSSEENIDNIEEKPVYIREIGKIRRYSTTTQEFSEWEDLPCQTYGEIEPRRWCELNIDESIEIPLRRGGRLRVFPNFVADGRRQAVANAMDKCTLYRQYWREGDEDSLESRIQALLSSKTNRVHSGSSKKGRPGYVYDGVTMMAQPLSHVPDVEKLCSDLAELYRLPGKEWNIGANIVCYRNGEDHMAWNSNCEQGEVLILCIIAESQNCTRPILIRPKGHSPLQDGDEEIIVFVGQGDAYEMDGQMQISYEHCMPKKEDDMSAKRSVVVFRHGKSLSVTSDTGNPLFETEKEKKKKISNIEFGHPSREITEGKDVYTRMQLLETGAHSNDRKLINGTSKDGCDSVLIEDLQPLMREDDGLCWIKISCGKSDGGGALFQNYENKSPIRVFRASSLDSQYAPALFVDNADQKIYRYDGLYSVRAIWDTEGNETEEVPQNNASKHTFFLMRCPKKPVDGVYEDGMFYNKMSIHELWNEIQKRSGIRNPRLFQVPQPSMELAPIGDKANLRMKKETIKLPSEENMKIRKARRKRKLASSPECFSDSNMKQLSSTRSIPLHHTSSNLMNESEISVEEDSDIGSVRPKRRSATAARSYLQEAMQNKNGVEKKSSDKKRRPSIHVSDQSANSKKLKSEDNSDNESSVCSDSMMNEILLSPGDKRPKRQQRTARNKDSSFRKGEDDKIVSKRNSSKKTKIDSAEAFEEGGEVEPDMGKVDFDPSVIKIGYRVNVEYRQVLYKATVRKVRFKQNKYQFQIHYDGNKKTNLRWIPDNMVHDILSEVPEEDNDQEQNSEEGKEIQSKQADAVPVEVQSITEKGSSIDQNQDEELIDLHKFPVGEQIYVQWRRVLYLATVVKTRYNRKGNSEYFIHYDGFKKTSDKWIKEDAIFEINEENSKRFEEQRSDSPVSDSLSSKKSKSSRKSSSNLSTRSSAAETSRRSRKRNDLSTNNIEDDSTLDMSQFDSGVEFLPGSCVFVVRKDALYLAKMVKRKKIGRSMEYLVHFDGSSTIHDTWVPLSSIYEINPQTRRIFDSTADQREDLTEDDEGEEQEKEDQNVVQSRRSNNNDTSPTRLSSRSSRKPAKFSEIDNDDQDQEEKVIKKTAKAKSKKPKVLPNVQPVDLSGIDAGCDFLPGSTIFVEWKNGLYLAKMLKKRGRRENMEYFVHYDGFRQSQDAWVSISSVYEINPQTKRAFNKQKKK